MKIDFQSQTPIFLQVSQGLEDEILSGIYGEEEQIPSITELSANYKINPATALKGINLLVDGGIVYKKRGIGMFVASGAVQKLKEKRQEEFYNQYILPLVQEAKRLDIEPQNFRNGLKGDLQDETKLSQSYPQIWGHHCFKWSKLVLR